MKNIPRMKHVKNQAVIQRQEGKLCVYVPPLPDYSGIACQKLLSWAGKKINRLANRPAYIFLIDAQLIGVALGALSIPFIYLIVAGVFVTTHTQAGW